MPQTFLHTAESPTPARPLASWYAPGLSDGLGDRLLMFDNSHAPSLELLRFRPDLADAPGFEAALREQVQRLARFQHSAFARVRSVQRLEPDGDLALISNHTPGKRLSEVLHRARGPAFAAALIRQLAPALAQFQQHHPGAAHGLLSADRIVVSPEARLTIVEHVIAPAIERLDVDTLPLGWMGIALPPGPDGTLARLDVATDWYQLGLVTLAALMGRPLTEDDLPRLERRLDDLSEPSGGDGAPLSPALRQWLDRTLQISGERIESSADAREAVADLLHDEGAGEVRRVVQMRLAPAPVAAPAPVPVETSVREPEPDLIARPTPGRLAAAAIAPAAPLAVPVAAPVAVPVAPPVAVPIAVPMVAPVTVPEAPPSMLDMAGRGVEQALSPFEREVMAGRRAGPGAETTTRASAAAPADVKRRTVSLSVAAGIALFAVFEAGIIAWLVRTPGAPVSAVAVETTPAGEHILVRTGADQPAPIQLTLGPDLRWVRMTSPSTQGVLGGKVAETSAGTLRILSPIALTVREGSRVLGSVPGADLRLLPGRHDLDLVNEALGYRLPHTVQVEPGQSLSIQVTPPPGSVTIQAAAGTEVSIDGQAVGATPLGPLAVAPGEHQVVLRHARNGSDRQRVTVKSGAATTVVAKLR